MTNFIKQFEEKKRTEFETAIEARMNKIKYEAKIIPQRSDSAEFSNNAVHWLITLNEKFKIEYSEGMGHFVHQAYYNKVIGQHVIEALKGGGGLRYGNNLQGVVTLRVKYDGLRLKATPPTIKDVLYSITMDADAVNYTFEEWAENIGYDADSRKALQTWHACTDNYRKLRALGFTLEEMQEYYQDY